jgi:hypothetical protein
VDVIYYPIDTLLSFLMILNIKKKKKKDFKRFMDKGILIFNHLDLIYPWENKIMCVLGWGGEVYQNTYPREGYLEVQH